MTDHEVIASETLLGQRPGEDRFVISIEIRKPFPWGGISLTEWACDVKVGDLYENDIHAEGSLQALSLALWMVRTVLNDFVQKGGRLTYENSEEFRPTNFYPAELG